MRTGMVFDAGESEFPEVAVLMLRAKNLNEWIGTRYSLEDVAEMDQLLFDIVNTMRRALNPPKEEK